MGAATTSPRLLGDVLMRVPASRFEMNIDEPRRSFVVLAAAFTIPIIYIYIYIYICRHRLHVVDDGVDARRRVRLHRPCVCVCVCVCV